MSRDDWRAEEDDCSIAELEEIAAELEEEPETLTLLIVFFTTTSDSWTSEDFSERTDAAAKTRSLDLNWLSVDSASSALASELSSSRWNFLTRIMLELEMASCSQVVSCTF